MKVAKRRMSNQWTRSVRHAVVCAIVPLVSPVPAAAQEVSGGRVATSAVGQAGQRQTREQTAPSVQLVRRVAPRIENRVQSRVRNRIDRFYGPQANAFTPFAVAENQTRTAGRGTRR